MIKILHGNSDANIDFEELKNLLVKMDFTIRVKGSHHIFTKKGMEEIINLQQIQGNKAKPYQVKQIRQIFLENNLYLQHEK